jgi:integrative and conjugative element protein (TIGR02256 family)
VKAKKEKIVWLKKSVLEMIMDEMNKWYPNETGGVLIGYWNENQAVITHLIDGGPNAVRSKTSFIPNHKYQVDEISKIYKISNRTETYLGDWHTHPDVKAYLSNTDKKTFNKIARYKPARLSMPLMIIVGTKPLELKVWGHEFHRFFKTQNIELNFIVFD